MSSMAYALAYAVYASSRMALRQGWAVLLLDAGV